MFSVAQVLRVHLLPSPYSPAALVLSLFMVVRLVPQSNALLLDLPPILAVCPLVCRRTGRHGVVLENPAHVVEQVCDGKEHIGPVAVVKVLQKELRILVSLEGRL